jgi:hypothetical protein
VLELRIAVGMEGAFARLGIGLQAEAEAVQQPADQLVAGGSPCSASAADKGRWLVLTHSSAASGSPRMEDCTNACKASRSPGWVSVAGLLPPPTRRTRSPSRAARKSARPHPIVLRAMPVARDTAATPPPPRRARFARRQQAAFSLVKKGRKRLVTGHHGSGVDHARRVHPPAAASRPFLDSSVAVLPSS